MLSTMFDFNNRFRLMEREMDRLFYAPTRRTSGVALTLRDAGKELLLSAELPGLSDKDVELTIEQGSLTIRAERKPPTADGLKALRQERAPLRIAETIELPVRVQEDKISASMKEGVLVVTLPKAEEARPRTIAIGEPKTLHS